VLRLKPKKCATVNSSKQKTYFLVCGLSSVRSFVAVELVPASCDVGRRRLESGGSNIVSDCFNCKKFLKLLLKIK